MSVLLLFLLLILNFGISCWNAYVAGRIWREAVGWIKAIAWCAIIMSACGFLMVSAVVLGFVAVSLQYIDQAGFQALLSMTYLMIILPVLGSGLLITIHSWIEAYKRRDFGSIATAGWNTFAQGYNTYEALDGGISSAFSNVASFFKPSDDDDLKTMAGKVAVFVVLMVAMVIAGGLTYVFFRMGRKAELTPQSVLQQRAA